MTKLYLDLKVRSKEGHQFNSRREVEAEILSHSANLNCQTDEYTYKSLADLNGLTDAELVGILSDFFSVPMEIVR